jgi:hypothetical protein
VRHRYERLDRFPDGLVVVGDAVCSFNPIYGQGMSVAAAQALALRRHLERGTRPQPRRLFGELARVVDVPWDIAGGGGVQPSEVGVDQPHLHRATALDAREGPGVQGRRTVKVRLVNAYLARLHAAAARDARLAAAFLRVAGLVAPPESLLRPGVVLGVARGSLRPAAGTRRHRHPDAVRAAQP